MEVASKQGCTEVEARGDSQLVVRQVTGKWQTKEARLRDLRDRVQELAEEFETFEIRPHHERRTGRLMRWWSKPSRTNGVRLRYMKPFGIS